MKKLSYIICFIFFIFILTQAVNARSLIAMTGDLLYISSDSGRSWEGIYVDSVASLRYNHLALDSNCHLIYAATNNCLLKSSNNGKNWTKLYPSGCPDIINRVFTSSGNGNGLYAVTPDALYFSPNFGNSWKKLGLPMKEAYFNAAFTSENRIFLAGGTRIMLSRDNGYKWENIAKKLPPETIILDISVNPFNSSELYAATGKGLFYTRNLGKDWVKRNISTKEWVRTNKINFTDKSGVLYASDSDTKEEGLSYLRRSINGGKTWSLLSSKDNIISYGFDMYKPDIIFYAYSYSANISEIYSDQLILSKSDNGGKTWTDLESIAPGFGRTLNLTVIPWL